MKSELGGKNLLELIKFVRLRVKTCSYLSDDNSVDKKAKGTKTCVIKIKLNCKNHKKLFTSNSTGE